MAVTHFKRSGQEMMNFPGFGVLDDQSAAIIFSNGGIDNPPNKRKKEASDVPIGGMGFLQPSMISPMINLDQLHTQYPPTVCTGLQLAFAPPPSVSPNLNRPSPITSSLPLLPTDFMTHINQYSAEVDQFLRAQAQQLGRTLVEKQKKNYKSLLIAAEQSATRIIGEKDAELERAARLTLELENRLARLKAESATWQARAVTEQSRAVALHAQLEQASAAAVAAANENQRCGESAPVDDAESVYVDADRPTDAAAAALACRACRRREVSVLILPCRHVSVCAECGASGTVQACPVCNCAVNGSVQVYLS